MKQLEVRIVIIHRSDKRIDIGMYDPVSNRYEPLGTHKQVDIDDVIYKLKCSIERAGHMITWCERSE